MGNKNKTPRQNLSKIPAPGASQDKVQTEIFHFVVNPDSMEVIYSGRNFTALLPSQPEKLKLDVLLKPLETTWSEIKKVIQKKEDESCFFPGFLTTISKTSLPVNIIAAFLNTGSEAPLLSIIAQPSPFSISGGSLHYNHEMIHTLDFIGDCIIEIDKNKNIFFINESAAKLFRLINLDGLDPNFKFYFNEIKGDLTFDSIIQTCTDKKSDILIENIHTTDLDGNNVYLDILIRPVFTLNKTISGYVLIIRNLTGTHIISEKLKWLANHDSLTGILNRRAFEDELARTIDYAQEDNSSNVMMYLDLDQFKIINDICGHTAGDELLRNLSSKISILLDERCTLARLGGDEFGIILANYTMEEAQSVANNLLETIKNHEFYWGKKKYEIGVSIGMVPIYETSISISHIMSMADIACYTAKDLGRNRIHVFIGGEMEYMIRHGEMQWISHIKKALQDNSFLLYSQKIVPIKKPGTLPEHREILVRMKGDDGQIYFPSEFIAAAERYNIIREIDRWVVFNTFKIIADQNLNKSGVIYSINLSGSSINDSSMSLYISDTMKKFHIPPKMICFEITENVAIANFSYAREFIRELKMIGFTFALDDFGSGLSSFNYLKNLPVDILKIDGHFVKNIHNDEIDFAMVKTIHNIGQTLNIKTVAEFVENKLILEKIRQIGIDYAQGFELSKPEPFI